MIQTRTHEINPDKFSKFEKRREIIDHGKKPGPIHKTDEAITETIYLAFWKDDVLRKLGYHELGVYVKSGDVHLSGHIVDTDSQIRIQNVICNLPDILAIKNDLVMDDKLTLEVAASLGRLENVYDCKFFTGVSHGVVSLNGVVSNENIKCLAEKVAASNPNVRGVINNVRVSGCKSSLPDQPFLQPSIGEVIYFLDGISANVNQVIINPNNRRVIAMTVTDPCYRFNSLTRLPQQLVTVPMSVVRYLTRTSGFLNIQSIERDQYQDFDAARFMVPNKDWVPPYPYCSEDVLFPIESRTADIQILEDASLREQFFATNSPDL
jgi:osmotically-inducible protein OsmY